MFNLALKND